jgi:perosamine synthetase
MMFEDCTRWPLIRADTIRKITGYLESGKTSMDVELLERFEGKLCRYFGVPHALATTTGSAAALSAFFALGLGPGDEIIAPCYTHWATVVPATLLGCRVVFADLEPASLSIDVQQVAEKINARTKAVVVCHLYGNPADVETLRTLCNRHNLYLIEDISHAPGATVHGKKVGGFGDIAFMSFQSTKLISGGEGGALLTNHFDCYARAVEFGHPKRIYSLPVEWHTYVGVGLGHKFRLAAIPALLASDSFDELDESIAIRKEMFEGFRTNLSDTPGIETPTQVSSAARVYFRWDLFIDSHAASLVKALKAQQIKIDPANFQFLPDLPHFEEDVRPAEEFPQARRLLAQLILLNPFTRRDERALADFSALFTRTLRQVRDEAQ